jgi:hypothetical protein
LLKRGTLSAIRLMGTGCGAMIDVQTLV